MSKQYPIQISIPHPCHEDWAQMQPNDKGRFCTHCSKTVIDFTTWSDTALYNFFSVDQGSVCGRFLPIQLSTPIHVPYQPHSRLYRLTIALGLTLLFTQGTEALAQQKPPMVAATPAALNSAGEIAGTILDEKKEPVTSAVVQVFNGEQLVMSTVSDYDGKYWLKPLPVGAYLVEMTFIGYDTMVTTKVPVTQGRRTIVNKVLTPVVVASKRHVSVTEYKKPLIDQENVPQTLGGPELKVLPSTDIHDLSPVDNQRQDVRGGVMTNIRSARTSGTRMS